MKQVNFLIIGAGVSGLTFANYCKNTYLLIEKEKEVGGYCRTIKKGEYVWDYAGHFFHFKTNEFKNKFLSKMSNEDIIYNKKCTKILYKDKFIDYMIYLTKKKKKNMITFWTCFMANLENQ